jgi:hypothetical protein
LQEASPAGGSLRCVRTGRPASETMRSCGSVAVIPSRPCGAGAPPSGSGSETGAVGAASTRQSAGLGSIPPGAVGKP